MDRTVSVNGEVRFGNLAGIRGLSLAYVLDAEYSVQAGGENGPERIPVHTAAAGRP